MSKIETTSVRVTKTVVRYTAEEYQDVLVRAAVAEAGVDPGHPGLATHVSGEGNDVLVELLVEESVVPGGLQARVVEQVPKVDPVADEDFNFARPAIS